MQQDGAKEILWIEHLGQQTLEDAVDRAIILRWVLERILKDGWFTRSSESEEEDIGEAIDPGLAVKCWSADTFIYRNMGDHS